MRIEADDSEVIAARNAEVVPMYHSGRGPLGSTPSEGGQGWRRAKGHTHMDAHANKATHRPPPSGFFFIHESVRVYAHL